MGCQAFLNRSLYKISKLLPHFARDGLTEIFSLIGDIVLVDSTSKEIESSRQVILRKGKSTLRHNSNE